MKRLLSLSVLLITFLALVGCKSPFPEDAASYEVEFLRGEMSFVKVSFEVEDQAAGFFIPAYEDSYHMAARALFGGEYDTTMDEVQGNDFIAAAWSQINKSESMSTFCAIEKSDEAFSAECSVFLPYDRINTEVDFKMVLEMVIDDEELCDSLNLEKDEEFKCRFLSPILNVDVTSETDDFITGNFVVPQATFELNMTEDGFVRVAGLAEEIFIPRFDLGEINVLDPDLVGKIFCVTNPTAEGCVDDDDKIKELVPNIEEAILENDIDPTKDDDLVKNVQSGDGGWASCTLNASGGSGSLGFLAMLLMLAPIVVQRGKRKK